MTIERQQEMDMEATNLFTVYCDTPTGTLMACELSGTVKEIQSKVEALNIKADDQTPDYPCRYYIDEYELIIAQTKQISK